MFTWENLPFILIPLYIRLNRPKLHFHTMQTMFTQENLPLKCIICFRFYIRLDSSPMSMRSVPPSGVHLVWWWGSVDCRGGGGGVARGAMESAGMFGVDGSVAAATLLASLRGTGRRVFRVQVKVVVPCHQNEVIY